MAQRVLVQVQAHQALALEDLLQHLDPQGSHHHHWESPQWGHSHPQVCQVSTQVCVGHHQGRQGQEVQEDLVQVEQGLQGVAVGVEVGDHHHRPLLHRSSHHHPSRPSCAC